MNDAFDHMWEALWPTAGKPALPAGKLPVADCEHAVRRYRAGLIDAAELSAVIDRNEEALRAAIARQAVKDATEFAATVRRLQRINKRLALSTAQAQWIERWPSAPASVPESEAPARPLTCRLDSGRPVMVSQLLDILATFEVDQRLLSRAPSAGRVGHRGRGPAMAALADANISTRDVAEQLGVSPGVAWDMLNGRRPPSEELGGALTRLVGADQADVIMRAIPDKPQTRAAISPALKALQDAGGRVEDIAALAGVQPRTVQGWLSGALRRPDRLGVWLDQLLGPAAAMQIMSLVPNRARRRATLSPAAARLLAAGFAQGQLAAHASVDRGVIGRWFHGQVPPKPEFEQSLVELVGPSTAAEILDLIPTCNPPAHEVPDLVGRRLARPRPS